MITVLTIDNFRSEAGAETGGNQHRRLGEASARDEFSGEAGSGQARDRDTPNSREFSGKNSDTRWGSLGNAFNNFENKTLFVFFILTLFFISIKKNWQTLGRILCLEIFFPSQNDIRNHFLRI